MEALARGGMWSGYTSLSQRARKKMETAKNRYISMSKRTVAWRSSEGRHSSSIAFSRSVISCGSNPLLKSPKPRLLTGMAQE